MTVCLLDMQPISPAVGGGRLRLLGLFHALGMETTYVGTYDWPDEPARDQWLTTTLREVTVPLSPEHFAAVESLQRRTSGKVVIDSTFHLLGQLSPAYVARAREAVRQSDIVVIDHPWVYPLVADAIDPSRHLLVYDAQNMEGLLRISMLDDGGTGTEIACEVIRVEREFCRAAHLILTCSHEDRILFHDLYAIPFRRMKLCPNGVFTHALKPATDMERMQSKQQLGIYHASAAIFLGSGYQFNTEAARFIIDELAPEFPSVLFVIAGGVGGTLPEFRGSSARSNVRITGMLSDEDKHLYLNACDVALNPMFGGSGTNIKMFDYLAAGLPVVTTTIGARGVIALPKNPGFLAVPPDRFAATLRMLLSHRSFARTVSRNARRLACNFYSWESISPSLGRLLAYRRLQFAVPPPRISLIAITNRGANQVERFVASLSTFGPSVELIVIDQSPQPWSGRQTFPASRFLYVHMHFQEIAVVANLGALLAQGEALVFSAEHSPPRQEWLEHVSCTFRSPEVAILAGSNSLNDLEMTELAIRQESFNSTEGFLPGSRRDTIRIDAPWDCQISNGRVLFLHAPPSRQIVDVSAWVGCTPREFVERAAASILGTHANPAAMAALRDRLESGDCDKTEAIREFMHLRVGAGLPGGKLVPVMPEVFKDESVYLFSLDELLKFDAKTFVVKIYRQLLRRDPDPADLSGNVSALRAGTITREDLVRSVLNSPEAANVGVQVVGVNTDLPRGADPGTLLLD